MACVWQVHGMGVAKWRCARLPGHVQDGDEELLPARRLHALPPLLQALQLGDRAPLGAHRACVLRVLRVLGSRPRVGYAGGS